MAPHAIDAEGYVKVLDTLQIADESLPSIFSLGDVAATGAPKAARPYVGSLSNSLRNFRVRLTKIFDRALAQAELVSDNIKRLLEIEALETYKFEDAPAIHLTLGIVSAHENDSGESELIDGLQEKSVIFRNPLGSLDPPVIMHKNDG